MIYLYDASAIICSGTLTKQMLGKSKHCRGDLNYYSFPTAGLYSLMGYLATDLNNLKEGDSIVVAFDCHFKDNIRKKYYPDYKANRAKNLDLYNKLGGSIPDNMSLMELRNHISQLGNYMESELEERVRDVVKDKSISIQKHLAKWMVRQMGVNVVEHPNLEGDDLIYSVCYKYGQTTKVLLRADDGDLHDCRFYAREFDMRSVSGRGKITPNSGSILGKILYGDLKDNVRPLRENTSIETVKKLNNALGNGLNDINIMGDPEVLKTMGFTDNEVYYIVKNHYLKTPKMIDVEITQTEFDIEKIEKMQSVFGFLSLLKRSKGTRYTKPDMKVIHENIYSSLPKYVKEWHDLVRYTENVDKVNLHMSTVENSESDTITDLEEILKIL